MPLPADDEGTLVRRVRWQQGCRIVPTRYPAVNLFDRDESDVRLRARQDGEKGIQTVESLEIGYTEVVAESPASPMRKELWTALLLAALAVLVLEWYIYNRRVYV